MFYYIVVLLFLVQNDCQQISKIRNDYHQLTKSKSIDDFIEFAEDCNCNQALPYLASATMQKAQYSFYPFQKLNYFNKGKKMLENYIKEHPNNIEARYIRLLNQNETPAFLNYKKNIEEDLNFILKNIHKSNLPEEYQQTILTHIKPYLTKK